MLQIHLITAKVNIITTGNNYDNVMKNSTSSSLHTGSTYHSSIGEHTFFGGWGGAISKFYWSEYIGKVQIFLIPGAYHTIWAGTCKKFWLQN